MNAQFISAINQICDEKSIPKEVVLETVEAALAAAYKKDYGERDQEVRVKINEETGELKAYISKEVVENVEIENLEISLEDAKKIKKDAKLEDIIEIEDTPTDFGRIAAQTAKQVIIQRIREAEREIVFAEYKDKEGELVNASVQRIEGNTVIVDLGQASGVLFSNEQVNGERYYIGQRLKVFIVKVEQSNRGPQVVVSRSHPGVVKKLFETEVPEIETGIVSVKAIAREAGFRTKIAVASSDANVDPVGSCVGQRGIRVQAVMAELGEEKIDVIPFSEDAVEFISNALSPAKVQTIELNEEEKKARVLVKEDQLSLAIGKSGQNVRLAAKLSGWNIDINVAEGSEGENEEETPNKEEAAPVKEEAAKNVEEVPESNDQEKTEQPTETPEEILEEAVEELDETPVQEETEEAPETPESEASATQENMEPVTEEDAPVEAPEEVKEEAPAATEETLKEEPVEAKEVEAESKEETDLANDIIAEEEKDNENL